MSKVGHLYFSGNKVIFCVKLSHCLENAVNMSVVYN